MRPQPEREVPSKRDCCEETALIANSELGRQMRLRLTACFPAIVLVFTSAILDAQTANLPKSLLYERTFVTPGGLPQHLARFLEQSGMPMASAAKAQVTLLGSITDSNGTRGAQLRIQAPGYLSYREGNARAVTFDGTDFRTKKGTPSSDDEAIAESLLAHFPDSLLLQAAEGGSFRRLGSHFRTDGGSTLKYTGPYWTIIAFSPRRRPGLARGKALQQELFIAINDQTGLIAEVRAVMNSAGNQPRVIQTQLDNWTQYGDQWLPGTVTRLENGKQVFRFQLQEASVGLADSTATFVP
ncbi:MAG: hypothetical protein LC130_16800 [Bryobacterales bacterium]|nr:hypothetical protein [Bryobacterales bacterium]